MAIAGGQNTYVTAHGVSRRRALSNAWKAGKKHQAEAQDGSAFAKSRVSLRYLAANDRAEDSTGTDGHDLAGTAAEERSDSCTCRAADDLSSEFLVLRRIGTAG